MLTLDAFAATNVAAVQIAAAAAAIHTVAAVASAIHTAAAGAVARHTKSSWWHIVVNSFYGWHISSRPPSLLLFFLLPINSSILFVVRLTSV
jgi:nucleoside-specific outer membrane channel protein Tsx